MSYSSDDCCDLRHGGSDAAGAVMNVVNITSWQRQRKTLRDDVVKLLG